MSRMKAGESKECGIVLKADVQGSLEAVTQALEKLSTPKVSVEIIHRGVGLMTESDVMLAAASGGIVVGFTVKAETGAEATAKHQPVPRKTYTTLHTSLAPVPHLLQATLAPLPTAHNHATHAL